MAEQTSITLKTLGCPYCDAVGAEVERPVVHRLRYSQVFQRLPEIADFEGWVEECPRCGIYLANPRYDEEEFSRIYRNLSVKGPGGSPVKRAGGKLIRLAMAGYHSPSPLRRAAARAVAAGLDNLLHIPYPPRPLPPGAKVLDVGCGDGFHLRCLAGQAELFATEIHPGYAPMLAAGPESIRHWIKEFTAVDWERETGFETFDLIVFQSVFYRLNNPVAALDLAWRLLKPGGSILRIEPFCANLESVKLMTRFNFPQGFTFVRDPVAYARVLLERCPGAELRFGTFHGWSSKLRTGRELTIPGAALDALRRTTAALAGKEPCYLRLDMRKPEGGRA